MKKHARAVAAIAMAAGLLAGSAEAADRYWTGTGIHLPDDLGGTSDKAGVTLGGSTAGNTVSSITWANSAWHYSALNKTGSSTWTLGNVDTGIVNVNAGTLIGSQHGTHCL